MESKSVPFKFSLMCLCGRWLYDHCGMRLRYFSIGPCSDWERECMAYACHSSSVMPSVWCRQHSHIYETAWDCIGLWTHRICIIRRRIFFLQKVNANKRMPQISRKRRRSFTPEGDRFKLLRESEIQRKHAMKHAKHAKHQPNTVHSWGLIHATSNKIMVGGVSSLWQGAGPPVCSNQCKRPLVSWGIKRAAFHPQMSSARCEIHWNRDIFSLKV